MRRREFITSFLLAAAPKQLRAQTSKVFRLALVDPMVPAAEMTEASEIGVFPWRAFLEELRRPGYLEGQNVLIDRFPAGRADNEYADVAREVVHGAPDVIVCTTTPLSLALQKATRT